MHLFLFVASALGIGFVAAGLIRIYAIWNLKAQRPRSPLSVLFWSFYIGAVFVGAIVASSWIESAKILGELDQTQRLLFACIWFMPVAITTARFLIPLVKQNRGT